jgi:hypothetical protein
MTDLATLCPVPLHIHPGPPFKGRHPRDAWQQFSDDQLRAIVERLYGVPAAVLGRQRLIMLLESRESGLAGEFA